VKNCLTSFRDVVALVIIGLRPAGSVEQILAEIDCFMSNYHALYIPVKGEHAMEHYHPTFDAVFVKPSSDKSPASK
jgi:hypothetical protein